MFGSPSGVSYTLECPALGRHKASTVMQNSRCTSKSGPTPQMLLYLDHEMPTWLLRNVVGTKTCLEVTER